MSDIRIGERGNKVIQVQLLLNGHLRPQNRIKNDGHFGRKTERAVKAFQKKKGLVTDGIVGPKTWRALGVSQINIAKGFSTQSTLGAPWYNIAVAEIGVKEILGADKHNRRIIEYHSTTTLGASKDEVPWCSSFVNWVIRQSGFEGTNNALAKSWTTWGAEVKTPKKGDIVVIKRRNKKSDVNTGSSTGYHVGFYVTSSSSVISILGGNQNNQVKESNFMLRSYEIITYRRPMRAIIGVPLHIESMMRFCA